MRTSEAFRGRKEFGMGCRHTQLMRVVGSHCHDVTSLMRWCPCTLVVIWSLFFLLSFFISFFLSVFLSFFLSFSLSFFCLNQGYGRLRRGLKLPGKLRQNILLVPLLCFIAPRVRKFKTHSSSRPGIIVYRSLRFYFLGLGPALSSSLLVLSILYRTVWFFSLPPLELHLLLLHLLCVRVLLCFMTRQYYIPITLSR